MSRRQATRIAAWALAGTVVSGILLSAVAEVTYWLRDYDAATLIIAPIALLLMVAFLIGIFVLMYGLYAAIRGPLRDRAR